MTDKELEEPIVETHFEQELSHCYQFSNLTGLAQISLCGVNRYNYIPRKRAAPPNACPKCLALAREMEAQ